MAALVQSRRPEQIQLGIHWRNPPLEHDSARDGEWVTIPGSFGRVRGESAVDAVVVDELLWVINA